MGATSSANSQAVEKRCCVCGVDVANQKRTKDSAGNYYCQPCWSHQSSRQAQMVVDPPAPQVAISNVPEDVKIVRSKRRGPTFLKRCVRWIGLFLGTLAVIAAIAGVCLLFSSDGSDSRSSNEAHIAAPNTSARDQHPSEPDISKTAASTNPPAVQQPIEKRDLAAEAAQREEAERRERSRNENIYDAAKYGDIDRVKELLAVVPDQANARNSAQRTPLFECKNAQVAELLINAGADVNAQDIGQRTALMDAAVHCNVGVAETLIAHGADVNATTNTSETPILKIRTLPDIDPATRKAMYRLLVKHGANINAITFDGHTLLNDAARDNDLDSVKLFVELGASNQVSSMAHSAYREAVLAGAHDTAQFLKAR